MHIKQLMKGLIAITIMAFSTVTNAQEKPVTKATTPVAAKRIIKINRTAPLDAETAAIIAELDALNAEGKALRIAGESLRVEGEHLSAQTFTVSDDENNFFNGQELKSKEVSQEISTSKNPDIYIDNTSRNIVVKTWEQSKVKVTTTVIFEGDGKLSDEEWFEKLNLSVKTLGASIKIKSGSSSGGSYTINGNTFGFSTQPQYREVPMEGQKINTTSSSAKRVITIYIPAASKLDIESKYADVQVSGNIGKATIDLTNGSMDAENFTTLYLRSKYANVTVGNISNAEIEFINGRLTTGNMDDADVDTKYSTIEMAAVKNLIFRSTNDEYEIEGVDHIRGRKNYGNLRINKLYASLELDGTNADVKVRSVNSGVSLIRIDNKYADIRLPLKEVKNYSINYTGPYSTVYGNFEKQPLKEEPKAVAPKDKSESLASTIREINRAVARASEEETIETRFSAAAGGGKGLKIEMKCQNCTVDFK